MPRGGMSVEKKKVSKKRKNEDEVPRQGGKSPRPPSKKLAAGRNKLATLLELLSGVKEIKQKHGQVNKATNHLITHFTKHVEEVQAIDVARKVVREQKKTGKKPGVVDPPKEKVVRKMKVKKIAPITHDSVEK